MGQEQSRAYADPWANTPGPQGYQGNYTYQRGPQGPPARQQYFNVGDYHDLIAIRGQAPPPPQAPSGWGAPYNSPYGAPHQYEPGGPLAHDKASYYTAPPTKLYGTAPAPPKRDEEEIIKIVGAGLLAYGLYAIIKTSNDKNRRIKAARARAARRRKYGF